jgi:hypothetical protein
LPYRYCYCRIAIAVSQLLLLLPYRHCDLKSLLLTSNRCTSPYLPISAMPSRRQREQAEARRANEATRKRKEESRRRQSEQDRESGASEATQVNNCPNGYA